MSDGTALVAFDPVERRPGCVLTAAAMGADTTAPLLFPTDSWLLAPTDNMRVFRTSPSQMDKLVAMVGERYQ